MDRHNPCFVTPSDVGKNLFPELMNVGLRGVKYFVGKMAQRRQLFPLEAHPIGDRV